MAASCIEVLVPPVGQLPCLVKPFVLSNVCLRVWSGLNGSFVLGFVSHPSWSDARLVKGSFVKSSVSEGSWSAPPNFQQISQ